MMEDFFKDKTVLVMGLGRFGGGVDVVKFACKKGAKVIVTDLAKQDALAESIGQLEGLVVEYHLGSHEPADFETADMVVVNPAVPLDNKFVQIALKAGRKITSQIELFFELCPAAIIGVTGANGKSTTTALTAHILRSQSDRHIWLSGNIGNEPMLTIVDKIKPDDLVVLELSSFQIEQLAQSKKATQVALLTNLTLNHLDRYKTFERYCDAKRLIFDNQKLDEKEPAISIFNGEDKVGSEWFEKYGKDAGRLCIKFSPDDIPGEIRAKFGLPGRANLSNLAAAVAVARNFGVTNDEIVNCLSAFKALPHRLQLVAEGRGVKWFNDSKATTPDSAIVALEAFDCPIIIITGGYDKHIPFDEFGRKIAQKAKAAILIGQTAQVIAMNITKHPQNRAKIKFAETLEEAVKSANELAEKGDVVVLSPACASYDMFENYRQRGQQFIDLAGKFAR
ncbi:MAG: UDP-N-acetylmuramoyl-L-alanine--D-glutamate ligase [Sedimentisphaerales bacterium]|nr:UDP-N-acetylmuramoyl-L-alanine--D-glutamate ligase [Sedimentisphaerales bacterium]